MANLYSLIGQKNEQRKMNELVASDTATAKQKAAGVIAYYAKYDQQKASELYNYYRNESTNVNSKYYAGAYASPSNPAVSKLAALGFDMSVVDDNWFNQYAYLKDYLRYNGNSNTPSAPGKKASLEEQAAYQYYQLWKGEEGTKKIESQWQGLKDDIYYWANRTDRNYSDEEILRDKIDWSKYKDLTNIYNPLTDTYNEANDLEPKEYNRAIGYGREELNGALWAARNGGGTGNDLVNAGMYYLGEGNQWQYNPEISAKLEPLNSDGTINADYHPYSVGSTIASEDALFFRISGADDQWLQDNQRIKYYGTDEEKKHYANIEASVNNQHATDAAEQAVYDYVNYLINKDLDSSEVKNKLDTALAGNKLYVKTDKNGNKKYYTKKPSGDYEEIDLGILNDIDASVGKNIGKDNQINPNGKLVPLSTGTNYKYDTMIGQIDDWYAKKAQQPNDTETANSMIDDMAYSMPEMKFSSEAEAKVFQFKYTTDQQKTVNAKNKKVKEAVILTNDILSDDENIVCGENIGQWDKECYQFLPGLRS